MKKANGNGAVHDERSLGIFEMAKRAIEDLDHGRISLEHASTKARLMRQMTTEAALELEHAKKTKRLKEGSPVLPGFRRAG